ncbi:MAG: histidinol-phosphate transaminase [Lachnospiraceae bacterium]|nr:histidinol-phosphate transaminase [Lachnospiraceae bacterium]
MSWESNVRKVVPYVPGEQPKVNKVIKLNTNENPYPPAPGVQAAMESYTQRAEELRLYPSPTVENLVNDLAEYYHLSPEQVFVGVGSDDVLATAFLTFFNGEKPVVFPDITYSFYEVWAQLYRIPYMCRPVDEKLRLRKEDYIGEYGGVVIANPNAPTAIAESREWIEEIIKANPNCVVIVDEAYVDFGAETCIPLIEKYENLLVVQTYSKSRSLAGLRVGIGMGNPKLIRFLNDVKFSINSYTINRPTLEYASESLKDEDYFRSCVERICKTREWTKEQLEALGFSMTDSKTNFLFVKHESVPAEELFEMLKAQNIYVRHFKAERVNEYLRISIGTEEEMKVLIRELNAYLAK